MNKAEAEKRIEKLKEVINRHRYLYHVEDRQEISPEALDSLKHELFLLEQQYPDFVTPDSPTQRVAGQPLKGFKKVEHMIPMLSIEDIFSEKELRDWEGYINKLAPGERLEYFCEQKIDGFAVSLIYKDGFFASGSTRGAGLVGEDVTQNLKTIESIPLNLRVTPDVTQFCVTSGVVEVRGEVYMEKKDFEKLNKELEKKGQKTFANPRNLAAGSIRQLDPKLAASRPLRFLAYDLVGDLGQEKHSEEHKILKELGFKTDQGRLCGSILEIVDYWYGINKKRETLPYQIDGIVVSVNDNDFFQKLGVAGKSPRGIRAFKFSPKQAATTIENIILQVGRTGAITPVAVLRPVEIGGTTVSRATLHNEDEIKRLGVKVGDTVIVGRAGDVIPDVIRVLAELRTGKEKDFHFPSNCPVCSTKLSKPSGEVIRRCLNSKCPARRREYFYHFIKVFDIKGLGPKIIDRLLDENLISDPADLFSLKEGDLLPLERFAEKSASNIISAVRVARMLPLRRFIFALGISNIGEQTAIDLAEQFGLLENLKIASPDELQKISKIGPIGAKSIYDFFQNKKNLEFIQKLKKSGVKIENWKLKIENSKLRGLTFVLTGTLDSMSREEAKKKVRLLGGEVSELVSGEIDFLAAGTEPGSKLEKAKKLGIKIINEKEFLDIIG